MPLLEESLDGVVLEEFVEGAAPGVRLVQQTLMNGSGEISPGFFGHSVASRYGRMIRATRQRAAYRIRASTLSRRRSR